MTQNITVPLTPNSFDLLQQQNIHGQCDLTNDYSFIVCEGMDAEDFLQGQITADVNALLMAGAGLNTVNLGSCCTPQGRMIGLFHIAKIASTTFWIVLPKSALKPTLLHLKKYSIFSKVTLEENPELLRIYGIFTPNDNSPIKHRDPEIKVLPLDRTDNRLYFIICKEEYKNDQLQPFCNSFWKLALLINGIPYFDETLSAQYMPSDLHIDKIGGVSFKKGCYTGQEPIARLHYKGKPKFVCVLVEWFSEISPELSIEKYEVLINQQKIGDLIQYIELENNYIGFARIRIDAYLNDETTQLYLPQWHAQAELSNLAYNIKRRNEIMQGKNEDAEP